MFATPRSVRLIFAVIVLTVVGFWHTSSASAQPTSRDDQGVVQVWADAGCFPMGANTNQNSLNFANAHPLHNVCLTNGFWIDQFDVTNAAYQKFVDAGGYNTPKYWSPASWQWLQIHHITGPLTLPNFDAPQQPRVGVSWYEAEAYAQWRGGRLPTEAEWEYAARGPQGLIYPWGNTYSGGKANIDERPDGRHYLGTSSVVGAYPDDKSWVGAYDMAGNVWQWTADYYQKDIYRLNIGIDPQGPSVSTARVLRGGSWGYDEDCAMTAYRFHATPDTRGGTIGFRIVTSLPISAEF